MSSVATFKGTVVNEGVKNFVEVGFLHSDLPAREISLWGENEGEHLCLKLIVDFKLGPFITHSRFFFSSPMCCNLVYIPFTYISSPLVIK